MAVFRLERTRDYTVMSNHHLRDKRLSLKAKGLLSQMLSFQNTNLCSPGIGAAPQQAETRHFRDGGNA